MPIAGWVRHRIESILYQRRDPPPFDDGGSLLCLFQFSSHSMTLVHCFRRKQINFYRPVGLFLNQ